MKRSVAPVLCVRTVQPQLQPSPQQPQPNAQRLQTGPQFQPLIDGTAFFITGRGDFITAAHVANDFAPGRPLAGCQMMIWFASAAGIPGSFNAEAFAVEASNCVNDENLDLARCRTIDDLTKVYDGHFEPEPVEFESNQRDDGTAIAVTGFPLFSLTPITSRGYIGGYPLDSRGPVQMVIDRAAWPGGSGSPVYDSRGKVLGLLDQAGEGAASGISVARTSFAISTFLAAHPISDK